MTTDELLAAYLDGVAELDPAERRRVDELLRDHPAARAEADATRAILDRLRALPNDAHDPDWSALERGIRAEVGASVPRPRWRVWMWLGPLGAVAAAAACAALWLRPPTPVPVREANVPAPSLEVRDPTPATAVWLDGKVFELGDVDPAVLDDTRDTVASGGAELDDLGILPVDDLGWVDALDDTAVEQAEHWLARKKG